MTPFRAIAVVVVSSSLAIAASAAPAWERGPRPVSPGAAGTALSAERCPTFSWTQVPGTEGYELAAYALSSDLEPEGEEPALWLELPAGATNWTPPLERCLERGKRYAWSVRALGLGEAPWGEVHHFLVPARPSDREIADVLAHLKRDEEAGDWVGERVERSAPQENSADPPQTARSMLSSFEMPNRRPVSRGDGLGVLSPTTVGTFSVTPSGVSDLHLAAGDRTLKVASNPPGEGGDLDIEAGHGFAPTTFSSSDGGDLLLGAGLGETGINSGVAAQGGSIVLTAGRFVGPSGANGRLRFRVTDQGSLVEKLTISDVGISFHDALQLAETDVLPACSLFELRHLWVYDRSGPTERDAVCICLDTNGSGGYGWVDLTGHGGCP